MGYVHQCKVFIFTLSGKIALEARETHSVSSAHWTLLDSGQALSETGVWFT